MGNGRIQFDHPQNVQPTDEKRSFDEFFRSFENPLLLAEEETIKNDSTLRNISSSTDREKLLIRALAAHHLMLTFERVYNSIWATQVAAIRFINVQAESVEVSELSGFYQTGKEHFPDWYQNKTFDDWIDFLRESNLLRREGSRVSITPLGHEFLKYLVALRRPGPFQG